MTTTITIPTLHTTRLVLRAPRMSDFEAYAAFRGSPRAVFLGGPYDRATAFEQLSSIIGGWHLRGYGRWMVADADTDAPLGIVGLFFPEDWPEPEISWSLFEGAEGRGIAHEAALAARDHAYGTLGWTTAISMIDPANTRSAALGRRMGALPVGQFDHPEYGMMSVWRHPAPATLRSAGPT